MDKYSKYSILVDSVDNQRIELPPISKTEVKDVSDRSTPKDMATFVTKKLVEFIERDLRTKKGGQRK